MKILTNKEYNDMEIEIKTLRDMYDNSTYELRNKNLDLEERIDRIGEKLYCIIECGGKKETIIRKLREMLNNLYR